MELLHVLGNTYAAVAATALLPVYKLNDRDVVLIDTGYAKLDRAGLTALIDGQGWRLRAILCSHAHFDHTGNVRYLQERYGAKAAISLIEAGISVNPDSYRANYVALTYGKSRELFLEECFTADRVIFPQEDHIDVDGARFGVLSLPGHSAGQLGFVTPDGAAYSPCWADVAKAYGVESIRVGSAEEFKPAMEQAVAANKAGSPVLVAAPMEHIVLPTPGCWNINDIYSPNDLVRDGKLVQKENGVYITPNHAKSHKAK